MFSVAGFMLKIDFTYCCRKKQVASVSLVLKDSDMESENLSLLIRLSVSDGQKTVSSKDVSFKETRSVTMNIFQKKYFLFKSFAKIELSYVFTINMNSTVENSVEK